jgi:hypothetical protein
VLDPRASIGDLTCEDLTVPVTLDNSRSLGVYEFVVVAFADEGYENEDFYYQETFALAAGRLGMFRCQFWQWTS